MHSWGGPMNGQRARQRIFRELGRAIEFDLVLETGTYRGTSTEFLAAVTGAQVETVESSSRFFEYSRRRFAGLPYITTHQQDSRRFLREFVERDPTATTLIYLDAHWELDLPLAEELEIIRAGWSRAVVVIDDFQVPDDDGYAYDDYGPGKALIPSYLPEMPGWGRFYPAARSTDETGAKRGCVALASPALVDVVSGLPSLRAA